MDEIPRKVSSSGLFGCSWSSRANGASFCHVDRMRPVVKSSPCRTSGSQACRGANPIFRARAMVIIVDGTGWVICWSSHCPVSHALVVLANRSIAAAVACVRKYLVVASTARGWWCWVIIGMMARVLSSRPIQATSQCELVAVIRVPKTKPDSREALM